MKNLMLFTYVLAIFFFTTALQTAAQQTERELLALDSNDYTCFQTLDCVMNSVELAAKGWNFVFDETVTDLPKSVTAAMAGRNVSLSASYNNDGHLIRATYKRKNLALPPALLVHLSGKDFDGWTMIANEKVMKDFNINKLEYRVTMQNGDSVTRLRFTPADIGRFYDETIIASP